MSLAVVFKSPEGIVLAADSRATLMAQAPVVQPLLPSQPGSPTPVVTLQVLPAYFDNATKLLVVKGQNHVGMVTYGAGAIGQTEPRTAHSYVPEFEAHLASKDEGRLPVEDFAREVGSFYLGRWNKAEMPTDPLPPNIQPLNFIVGGFDEGAAYGRVFEVSVPSSPEPTEKHNDSFGITWGGQTEFLERLIQGVSPQAIGIAKEALDLDDDQVKVLSEAWMTRLGLAIPYQFLPLQDSLDMASFLVSITSEIQTWMVAIRGVGGDIDVATITRTDGIQPISQKHIHAWGDG